MDNSFSCTGECSVNYNFLQELLGLNKSSNFYDCEIYNEKKIPNRKHKKKRIAKKWFKRYGYKTTQVKSNWKLSEYNNDNGVHEFMLVKSE